MLGTTYFRKHPFLFCQRSRDQKNPQVEAIHFLNPTRCFFGIDAVNILQRKHTYMYSKIGVKQICVCVKIHNIYIYIIYTPVPVFFLDPMSDNVFFFDTFLQPSKPKSALPFDPNAELFHWNGIHNGRASSTASQIHWDNGCQVRCISLFPWDGVAQVEPPFVFGGRNMEANQIHEKRVV